MSERVSLYGCLPSIVHIVSTPIFYVLSWTVAKSAECILFLIQGAVSFIGMADSKTLSMKPEQRFVSRLLFSRGALRAKPLSSSCIYRVRPKRRSTLEILWFWTLILTGMIAAISQQHYYCSVKCMTGARAWDQFSTYVAETKHGFDRLFQSKESKPRPLLSVTQIRVHHHSVETIQQETVYENSEEESTTTGSMNYYFLERANHSGRMFMDAVRAIVENFHQSTLSNILERGRFFRSSGRYEPQSKDRKQRQSRYFAHKTLATTVWNGTFYSHWTSSAARDKIVSSWKEKAYQIFERLNYRIRAESWIKEGRQKCLGRMDERSSTTQDIQIVQVQHEIGVKEYQIIVCGRIVPIRNNHASLAQEARKGKRIVCYYLFKLHAWFIYTIFLLFIVFDSEIRGVYSSGKRMARIEGKSSS